MTRLASYRVNDDSAASVTPQGRVTLLRRAETDLIVRYQSHVVSTRLATVINPGLAFDFSKLKRRNFIDDELFKRLESLKVPPSPPAGDAAFLRRVSLDLTGEQPAPDEVRRFLADHRPRQANQAHRPVARQPRVRRCSGGSSWATCSRSARPGRATGPTGTRRGSIAA